ncbi:hypothetical protein EON66_04720 [archaeon]|nr:MAG: hypothetical protein EON66_04720 [archaeon]
MKTLNSTTTVRGVRKFTIASIVCTVRTHTLTAVRAAVMWDAHGLLLLYTAVRARARVCVHVRAWSCSSCVS